MSVTQRLYHGSRLGMRPGLMTRSFAINRLQMSASDSNEFIDNYQDEVFNNIREGVLVGDNPRTEVSQDIW